MAVIRNPLNRKIGIRVNDRYDAQDVIIPNSLSQTKKFKDMERVSQLTQNNWNLSPFTREDSYRDIVVDRFNIIGRLERFRGVLRPDKYHQHSLRR